MKQKNKEKKDFCSHSYVEYIKPIQVLSFPTPPMHDLSLDSEGQDLHVLSQMWNIDLIQIQLIL
jgi:hypothetical protein